MGQGAWRWLIDVAASVGGYAGIFVVSVLGNLIPLFPVPYLAAVFLYSAYVPGANPLLVGIISGLGGGVGKLAVYLMSLGASKLLSPEKLEQLKAFRELIGNYGALAVFLFAATPSPDDVVIALLGVIRYSATKFFIAVTAGKIVISVATAYFGKAFSFLVSEENMWLSFLVSTVLLALMTVVLLKVDWVSVLEIVSTQGWAGLLKELRRRGVKCFTVKGDGRR